MAKKSLVVKAAKKSTKKEDVGEDNE